MAYLVLVRHGESEWNKLGRWTGLTDISLSEKGKVEAIHAAALLQGIRFNVVFVSSLSRAKETFKEIKKNLHLEALPLIENAALNERDYGVFTGKDKWKIKEELGEEQFLKIRRGWDTPIPQGESLKDVYNRVVPYYQAHILPYIRQNENVLVVAHGNSIRVLVKYLENISDADISHVELATGEVYIYTLDTQGNVEKKDIKKTGNI